MGCDIVYKPKETAVFLKHFTKSAKFTGHSYVNKPSKHRVLHNGLVLNQMFMRQGLTRKILKRKYPNDTIVGLTGGIASGKTTIVNLLKKKQTGGSRFRFSC